MLKEQLRRPAMYPFPCPPLMHPAVEEVEEEHRYCGRLSVEDNGWKGWNDHLLVHAYSVRADTHPGVEQQKCCMPTDWAGEVGALINGGNSHKHSWQR